MNHPAGLSRRVVLIIRYTGIHYCRSWLPLTRELSAKLTEGEMTGSRIARTNLNIQTLSLPPSKPSVLPPPSSEGGKRSGRCPVGRLNAKTQFVSTSDESDSRGTDFLTAASMYSQTPAKLRSTSVLQIRSTVKFIASNSPVRTESRSACCGV